MGKPTYRRKKKLIKPKFQIKVGFACLGIATMSVLVLMIMMNAVVLDFAEEGLVDAAALKSRWVGVLLTKLGLALAILAPMTLSLGILLMHRVAGPLYRFEVFLRQVVRGEHEQECRIRKGDELVEFCTLLNQLTKPLREGEVDRAPFAAAMGEAAALLGADEPEQPTDVGDGAPAQRAQRVAALEG